MAVGANSFVARLLGAGDKERADEVLSTAFFLVLGAGLVFGVLGSVFVEPLVELMGATDTCREYAIDYATYVLLAAPFMATSFVLNQCLRAEGSAMRSMFGMGLGGVLNCILDPIFISGLGMGVLGASVATAISKVVSFAVLLSPYLAGHSVLRLSVRCVRVKWSILGEIISVGMPSMLRSLLAVLTGVLLNRIAGEISDSLMAAIGVATKIMMFPFSIVLGFGSGFQPVAGFNWGARRFDRVRECFRYSSRMALWGSVAMALVLGVLAGPISGLFSKNDGELLRLSALCIQLQCVALPIHAWVAVVNMLCAGLGYGGLAFLLATARQGTCFLPILLPMTLLMGEMGVVSIQAVADVLTLLLGIPICRVVIGRIRKAETDSIRIE